MFMDHLGTRPVALPIPALHRAARQHDIDKLHKLISF
jgi:hypothetical protein